MDRSPGFIRKELWTCSRMGHKHATESLEMLGLLLHLRPCGMDQRDGLFQQRGDCLMRKQKGFSLIELLIVVAIILIIAAIAIPNLMRARIAANESAGASTVRTLNTAEVTYSTTYSSMGYAPSLVPLGPAGVDCTVPSLVTATSACLIDGVLGAAAVSTKGAFKYAITASTNVAPVPDYM